MNVHYGGETLEVHPVADLFPMLADDELQELADDIKQRGLLQAIVLDADGRVLDGRNRLAACELAGVEPTFEKYEGDDPDGYAFTVNVARRHLRAGARHLLTEQTRRLIDGDRSKSTKLLFAESPAHAQRLSEAGLVLDFAPDHVQRVMTGAESLQTAVTVARERKKEDAETNGKKERLRAAAPDLLDQVADGRLDLEEALGALNVRERRAEQDAEAARQDAEREAQQRRQEAGERATVEEIDKIRNGDGAPTPSFAQRAESGAITWKQAAGEAERWVKDRTDAIERSCQRLRNIASGWGEIRTILANPDGALVASKMEALGESDRRVIAGIISDLKERAGDV